MKHLLNCYIVQDFLPFYIDKSCSEETNRDIKEIKEVDYFKKVNHKMKTKSRTIAFLVCFMAFIGIMIILFSGSLLTLKSHSLAV